MRGIPDLLITDYDRFTQSRTPTLRLGLNVRDAIEHELTDLKRAKERYDELSVLISLKILRNSSLPRRAC